MGAAREDVWHVIKTYWPLLLGNALEWYESRLVRRKNCSQQVTCMGSIERNLINLGFSSLGISRHISIQWQLVLSSSTFVTLIRSTTIWKSAIIQASAMLFLWLVSHVPRISGDLRSLFLQQQLLSLFGICDMISAEEFTLFGYLSPYFQATVHSRQNAPWQVFSGRDLHFLEFSIVSS